MKENQRQEFLHEALDRTHIASRHFQMTLAENVQILKDREIAEAFEKSVVAPETMYQQVGNKMK